MDTHYGTSYNPEYLMYLADQLDIAAEYLLSETPDKDTARQILALLSAYRDIEIAEDGYHPLIQRMKTAASSIERYLPQLLEKAY